MKLLFDQNLSHRLPARLADLFPASEHVRHAGLDRADDGQIWAYARSKDFCLVTQDIDFAERSRLYGAPPKVIWLRCGNSTPQQIETLLRYEAARITGLLQSKSMHCIELF